jgi:hypothetical protein
MTWVMAGSLSLRRLNPSVRAQPVITGVGHDQTGDRQGSRADRGARELRHARVIETPILEGMSEEHIG